MLTEKSPKFIKDNDPWLLGEEIPDLDIFFFQIPMSYFTNDLAYPFLIRYKKTLTHYKNFHSHFYVGEKDSFNVAEKVVNALVKNPHFGDDVNKNITTWSHKLIAYAKEVARLPLHTYTNQQLWQLYKKNDEIHTKLYTYGWLPVASDLFHNNFTKKLKSILYSACPSKEEAESAFVILTTPSKKTIVAEEREDFLKIYKKFKHNLKKPSQEFREELEGHSKKWGHLGYIYAGNVDPFGPNHYLQEMKEVATTGIAPNKILKMEADQLKKAKRNQLALSKKYKLSSKEQRLFKVAQEFALTKLLRRHAQLLNLYLLHTSLLEEIKKRFNLPRHLVQFMLMDEVKNALVNGQILSKKDLSHRFRECALYTERGFEKIYTGEQLRKFKSKLKREVDKNTKEFTGQTAQPGFARGVVKLIFRAKDIFKMNKGDILVSIATDPDVVPAMKKAAAIVTEQGGITSHAAIVSRELGIPCVIGTKIATKVLKDGDMVEVDATAGIIRKL